MSTEYLYIGSIIRAQMSDEAHLALGEQDWQHLVTQLRQQNGEIAIGAALIRNEGEQQYIGLSGSFAPNQIYEILARLGVEEICNLALPYNPGIIPYITSHYNDAPLVISLQECV